MPKDYTTLRVSKRAAEVAREAKLDDETWDEYLQRCGENPPPTQEFVDAADLDGEMPDPEAIAERVVKKLEGRRG